MKKLEKMLLINWHYIHQELLEFKDINFLTGKNGAGKSTIIDALQLVILGDTAGHYFNKAANEKSTRTLKGYLKGEVAEDDETNTVYLRDSDFSSYIVLEFRDTVEQRSFCLGVVFDSYSDGDYKHRFFYLREPLPAHRFYLDGVPMNIKTLRAFFHNHYTKQYDFFESNQDYREVMVGVLGHLNERFFRLFKKAVPFSPIMDIKGFITEFVCDVQNEVDITHMQENIRQYKQLEEELGLVEKRVLALEAISNQFAAFCEEDERYLIQKYLLDRAEEEKSGQELRELQAEISMLGERIKGLRDEIGSRDSEMTILEGQRDDLLQERAQSDIYKKQQDLSKDKNQLSVKLEEIKNSESRLRQIIEAHLRSWSEVVSWCEGNLSQEEAVSVKLGEIKERLNLLLSARQTFAVLEYDSLGHLKAGLEEYADGLGKLYFDGERKSDEIEQRVKKLTAEIEGLKLGIKPYPASLLELQQAIAAELSVKYNEEIKPKIFAELLEIKDQRWQQILLPHLSQ